MVDPAAQDGPARLGRPERVAGAVQVLGEVAVARVDVRGELYVVGSGCEPQGAVEVLVGDGVLAGVVSHPSRHLGQGGRRGEHVAGAGEQLRRDLVLEVANDGAVHVSAADLSIGVAEGLHDGLHDRVTRCRFSRPQGLDEGRGRRSAV